VQHYIIGGHETKGLKRNFGFWILGFGLEEKSIVKIIEIIKSRAHYKKDKVTLLCERPVFIELRECEFRQKPVF
jgi:hypothetical protein